jgi:DNA-binding response OmpR family regulator/anti-sigma regulatory factor (Ser/Thr protein kinase)
VSGQLNEHAVLWVDKDKFDKIIFNLLSNAFKFSSSGKKIELMLREDPDNIIISIIDQGIGISKDKLKYLFDRFESIANTGTGFQASTGIGLSLTKELIEMHKAEIQVESDPGMGTVFNLTFKKGVEHYRNSGEIILTDSEDTEFKADSSESYPESEENTLNPVSTENERDLKKILIVEDNTELRNFLKTILSENYEVIEADNGNKAFELTLSSTPDLIISDIMMPDMDGLQLAAKIKGDMNISHTPLILLTAKIDTESKLKALEYGVDDYITKPFSSAYLEARIENLLKLRMQLQQYFRSSLTSGVISIAKPELIGQDEVFISKTMMYIEENYENSEMNVEDIALNLGMSRSSFFKKLKSLTGIAPVDFVREFRIQRALQMMDAGETNISQISFSVGINDARYFSKCFKQKFGINPSEYKSRIQQ